MAYNHSIFVSECVFKIHTVRKFFLSHLATWSGSIIPFISLKEAKFLHHFIPQIKISILVSNLGGIVMIKATSP